MAMSFLAQPAPLLRFSIRAALRLTLLLCGPALLWVGATTDFTTKGASRASGTMIMMKQMKAALVGLTLALSCGGALAGDEVGGSAIEFLRMNLRYDGRPQASSIPREIVSFNEQYAPGTIIVNATERRLYFVLPEGKAIRYGVGVGRPGFEWAGTHAISNKREWPDWTPPAQMLKRRPDLPRHMSGGPENPLGARAMYLGSSLYRIHGSNEPDTIGQAVSSGCIRMTNDDVMDLYERAKVGTRVLVMR